MKPIRGRRLASLLLVAVVSGVFAGAALAGGAGGQKTATVKVVTTADYGKVLATSGGLTLYHYTDETRGKVDCKGACAKLWPPLLVKAGAKPTAGAGLTASKLGTLRRPDGGTQVTYNGLGLYRYAPDRKAGDVKGQGLFKVWFVIAPSGKIVKRAAAAAAAPPPASPPPPTESAPPGGGGYDYG
jgi:predicted lipoprotein with Yx(FWY)xxD motif